MIRSGITCRHIMVQSVYILNILTGQYTIVQNIQIKVSKDDSLPTYIITISTFTPRQEFSNPILIKISFELISWSAMSVSYFPVKETPGSNLVCSEAECELR